MVCNECWSLQSVHENRKVVSLAYRKFQNLKKLFEFLKFSSEVQMRCHSQCNALHAKPELSRKLSVRAHRPENLSKA